MSSYHLYFIKPVSATIKTSHLLAEINTPDTPTEVTKNWIRAIRADIWRTPYKNVLLVMAAFHISQYLALPVFPLFFVRFLKLTDQDLGIGSALFYVTVLLGSTQLSFLVRKMGHKNVTGWSVVGLALYPGFLALSSQVWHYYAISILGGLAFAYVVGASPNYILEKCPENDRPSHLAWYNIILNSSILLGSLLGPSIAHNFSLQSALIIFSIARALAGLAILKWG